MVQQTVTPKGYPITYDALETVFHDMSATGRIPPIIWSEVSAMVGSSACSCGVSVLSGLKYSTSEEIVHKILKERHQADSKKIREAFVMFSDVVGGPGEQLYAHIKKNNVGEIVEFGPRKNPNTGNMIKLWVWTPPHESLESKNRHMPVYGMRQEDDSYGQKSIYKTDPRFIDLRGAREA
jgi:hypothetical protein